MLVHLSNRQDELIIGRRDRLRDLTRLTALRHAVWALGVPVSRHYYEIMRVPDAMGRVATHGAKRTGCERPACTGKVSAEGSRSRRTHAHSGSIVGAAAEDVPAGGGAGAGVHLSGRT